MKSSEVVMEKNNRFERLHKRERKEINFRPPVGFFFPSKMKLKSRSTIFYFILTQSEKYTLQAFEKQGENEKIRASQIQFFPNSLTNLASAQYTAQHSAIMKGWKLLANIAGFKIATLLIS